MTRLTKRRRWLLLTGAGGLAFLVLTAVAAVRWRRGEGTYRPGEQVDGITAELARSVPTDHPRVSFTDVTRAAGIGFQHFSGKRASWLPEDMGSGAAWGDFDGDGWLDLAVANEVGPIDMPADARRRSPARATLYRNNRDGTFTDVSETAGVAFRGWGMAAAWADYDADGHLDLLLTAYGRNVLYHNEGNGTFTDRSAESGVGAPEGYWAGAAWGDYDRDGRVDLYVAGYVKFTRKSTTTGVNGKYDAENPASINPLAYPGERNLLFHNEGGGRFTERAAAAGVTDTAGRSLAVTWADLDEDGWPDLYVANDVSQNVLYRNLGDGTFREIAEVARVSDYRSSMGIAVGDWNADATQDLFLTHWLAQGNALYSNLPRRPRGDSAATGRTPPPLAFMDEADRVGLGQISLDFVGWATSFVDYDNDGRLDLFVANGSTLQKRSDPTSLVPMRSMLFWNRGAEQGFFDVSPVSGSYFQREYVGRGAAFADYDNDGDMDVFVVNHAGPGVLLRNDGGNQRQWLQVELRGVRSDRQGLGAKLRVVAGGAAQRRQVGIQAPYLSQNSAVESFGLADATTVDTLEVRWPSGVVDRRIRVPANQRLVIVEGRPAKASGATSLTAPTSGKASSLDRASVLRFWAFYREATRARVAGDVRGAEATYTRALALDPDHEDVLYYAGGMRLELGDYAGALGAWRRLIAVNPSSARGHSRLGALFRCLDPGAPLQLDSAEVHLARAHEINKEENGPLIRLGEVALLSDQPAVARRYFVSVLKTHASNSPAHFYTGYLAYREGDLTRAHEELRKASAGKLAAVATASVPGEGDTKRGGEALQQLGGRCSQLRTRSERPRAPASLAETRERYRELDALLAGARRRLR